MQSVTGAFTAEAKDRVRKPAHSVQVSWKKDFRASISFFTIGVSTIGGPDIIPGPAGIQSAWNRYLYEDESSRVLNLDYERQYNLPIGGISKAMADVSLDNTSGRYLPDYMGGTSSIFTAVLPRRPIIINAGFELDGIDQTIPQFVGVLSRQPKVDVRTAQADLTAMDFVDFIGNRKVDQTAMFTAQRSDVLMETFLTNLGFATSQFELDQGRQTIAFLLLNQGDSYVEVMSKLAEAEGGQFYQNEEGRLIFENRVHWDTSPNNQVRTVIFTADVLEATAPDEDQIINVVEVKAKPRAKTVNQIVFKLGSSLELQANESQDFFVNFDDPMVVIDSPTHVANSASDGSGSDQTSNVTISIAGEFAQAAKYIINNNSASTVYVTEMTITGRPAKVTAEVYHRDQISNSVTAYEERGVVIENDFIQSQSQAESLATTILLDNAQPQNLQEITIRARPELQLGDLISWQGKNWRIWGITGKLNASEGFVQTLKLLQRNPLSYFTIGVSTIGGADIIAP